MEDLIIPITPVIMDAVVSAVITTLTPLTAILPIMNGAAVPAAVNGGSLKIKDNHFPVKQGKCFLQGFIK